MTTVPCAEASAVPNWGATESKCRAGRCWRQRGRVGWISPRWRSTCWQSASVSAAITLCSPAICRHDTAQLLVKLRLYCLEYLRQAGLAYVAFGSCSVLARLQAATHVEFHKIQSAAARADGAMYLVEFNMSCSLKTCKNTAMFESQVSVPQPAKL